MIVTGGCQCGAVRYRVARIGRAYACHCTECRRQSASAFAISVPVWWDELAVDGAVAEYRRLAASGATTACAFCPACGVRLYHRSSARPDVATLKGGTLDDTPVPDAHLWVSRKVAWFDLPADDERYSTQPDDLSEWRSRRLPPATAPDRAL